jgi:hypothetical protein
MYIVILEIERVPVVPLYNVRSPVPFVNEKI